MNKGFVQVVALSIASTLVSVGVAGCRGQCPATPPMDACPTSLRADASSPRPITAEMGLLKVDPWTIVLGQGDSRSVLTVAMVLQGLHSAKGAIDGVIANLSGELKSVGESYQKNLQTVIQDLNTMFEDRIDQTFDELNSLERRIAEDAELLIRQTHAVADQLAAGALDQAKQTIQEGDITAYGLSSLIPGRVQEPRLVYLNPKQLRADAKSKILKVRGNFLTNCHGPIQLDGQDVELISASQNEYVVAVPDTLFPTKAGSKTVALTADPSACEGTRRKLEGRKFRYIPRGRQSLSVVLLPTINYTLHVTILPQGGVPYSKPWVFPFYEKNPSCDKKNHSKSKNYCVPPGWTIKKEDGHSIKVTTANCGSRVQSTQQTNDRCIHVDAYLRSCGKNALGLNCKGHGWLGYDLTVNASTLQTRPLPRQEWTYATDDDDKQTAFTFAYDEKFPPGTTNIDWNYEVSLTLEEGDTTSVAELSEVNPNGQIEGWNIKTTMVDGRLSVELMD